MRLVVSSAGYYYNPCTLYTRSLSISIIYLYLEEVINTRVIYCGGPDPPVPGEIITLIVYTVNVNYEINFYLK